MTAIVTLSLEIELAWGWHDRQTYDMLSDDRTAETTTLETLIRACEQTAIPVTFDIVGHLFHESCAGHHQSPHPDEWFAEDPGTDVTENPRFYAPDLVTQVQDTAVEHEISTHTYSHPLLSNLSPETLDWEFEMATTVHEATDVPPPTTVVPPRHEEPPLSAVAAAGLTAIRRPFPGYSQPDGTKLTSLAWLLTRSHPVGRPIWEDGVLVTHCTPHPSLSSPLLPNGQQSAHPVFEALPVRVRQWIHRRYVRGALERAIRQDSHLHLWSHLANISNSAQRSLVVSILRLLASYRDRGMIEILPMESLPTAYPDADGTE